MGIPAENQPAFEPVSANWISRIVTSYNSANLSSTDSLLTIAIDLSELLNELDMSASSVNFSKNNTLHPTVANIIKYRWLLLNNQLGVAGDLLSNLDKELNGIPSKLLLAELYFYQSKKKDAANLILDINPTEFEPLPLFALMAFNILCSVEKTHEALEFLLATSLEKAVPWQASIYPEYWDMKYRLNLAELHESGVRTDRARHEARRCMDFVFNDLLLAAHFTNNVSEKLDDTIISETVETKLPQMAARMLESFEESQEFLVRDATAAHAILKKPVSLSNWKLILQAINNALHNQGGQESIFRFCQRCFSSQDFETIEKIFTVFDLINEEKLHTQEMKSTFKQMKADYAFIRDEFESAANVYIENRVFYGEEPNFLAKLAAASEKANQLEQATNLWGLLAQSCDEAWIYASKYLKEIEVLATRSANDISLSILISTCLAANSRVEDGIQLLTEKYKQGNRETELLMHLLRMLYMNSDNSDNSLQIELAGKYVENGGDHLLTLQIALQSCINQDVNQYPRNMIVPKLRQNHPQVIAMEAIRLCNEGNAHLGLGLLLETEVWKCISNPYALSMCEQVFAQTNKLDLALRCCERILEIEDDNEWAIAGIAKLTYMSNDSNSAIQMYNRALEIVPDYRFAVFQLTSILASEEKYDDAFHLVQTELSRSLQPCYARLLIKLTETVSPDKLRETIDAVIHILPNFEIEDKYKRFDTRYRDKQFDKNLKNTFQKSEFNDYVSNIIQVTTNFLSDLLYEIDNDALHVCAIVPAEFPRANMENPEEMSSEQQKLAELPRILIITKTIENNVDDVVQQRQAAIETASKRTGIHKVAEIQCIHLPILWNTLVTSWRSTCMNLMHAVPLYDETRILESLRLVLEHRDLVLDKFDKYVMCYAIAGSVVKEKSIATSDIDVWIVIDDTDVRKMTRQELLKKTRRIVIEMIPEARRTAASSNPNQLPVNIQLYLLTDYWTSLRDGNPIIHTLLRDGVPLYDRGIFSAWKILLREGNIRPSRVAIEKYVQSSKQLIERIEDKVKEILEEDLYYACLTICQAALMAEGIEPPSPGTAADLMKRVFVEKLGLLSEQDTSVLAQTVKSRKDIEHNRISGRDPFLAAELYPKAKELVSKVSTLIDTRQKDISLSLLQNLHEQVHEVGQDKLRHIGIDTETNNTPFYIMLKEKGLLPSSIADWFARLDLAFDHKDVNPEDVDIWLMEAGSRLMYLQNLSST